MTWRALAHLGLVAGAMLLAAARPSLAANGAYQVDDADIAKPGECKIESWYSHASNGDLAAVSTPACVVRLVVPVEVSFALSRARFDDAWDTTLVAKAKTNLYSGEGKNKVAVGLSIATGFDLVTHENTGTAVNIPVSIEFSEQLKANLNGGWSYDNITGTHYATWGAGIEWNFVKPLTLIAEIYGLVGDRPPTDPASMTDPRYQIGLRWTPHEKIDLDLIWGHNISGEGADWITAGLNLRF